MIKVFEVHFKKDICPIESVSFRPEFQDKITDLNLNPKKRITMYELFFGYLDKNKQLVTSMTGTGRVDEVFSGVKKALDSFILDSDRDIDALWFSSKEKSRGKVYSIFAKIIKKDYGFTPIEYSISDASNKAYLCFKDIEAFKLNQSIGLKEILNTPVDVDLRKDTPNEVVYQFMVNY